MEYKQNLSLGRDGWPVLISSCDRPQQKLNIPSLERAIAGSREGVGVKSGLHLVTNTGHTSEKSVCGGIGIWKEMESL